MTLRHLRRTWREPKRRLMATEADVLRDILYWLRLHGFVFIRHHPVKPVTRDGQTFWTRLHEDQKGAPDIIVLREHRPVCIEVKGPKGKMSAAQIKWKERALSAGCLWVTAKDVETVMLALPPREHQAWPVPEVAERDWKQTYVEGR